MSVREDAALKIPVVEVLNLGDEEESGLGPEESRDPEEVASQSESEPDDDDSSEEDWESESLYEDALQLIPDDQLRNGGKENNSCLSFMQLLIYTYLL